MSEQGWGDFLSADGVEDWVVLHGGPTAVFRVGSLEEAARLAGAVAAVWMQELSPGKSLRHAMHIDVSVAREVAEERWAAALAAGGRIVDESEAPSAWILSDRAGNKVCIAAWPDGAKARDKP